jgi:hypothetical protein
MRNVLLVAVLVVMGCGDNTVSECDFCESRTLALCEKYEDCFEFPVAGCVASNPCASCEEEPDRSMAALRDCVSVVQGQTCAEHEGHGEPSSCWQD